MTAAATTATTKRTPSRRGRGVVAVVLLVSLLAMAGMRTVVQRRHEEIVPRSRGGSRLSQMNTFALGLVLGGLRGPLVMFLWTSSENQKTDRNLQDIDTKIELIRMLQPEFDSVHIFQIWNKAYNLSVQMANLQNKYTMILDALDYAQSVDEERPDNINILMSMGEVYYQKLGQSAERHYYIPRMRQETLPKATPERLRRGQAGWRRMRHDTLLDERGMLLPALVEPDPGREGKPYDGAEYQFLREYSTPEKGGFPYGVSPLAAGFNYYKRANLLQDTTGQRHLNMSESVVSSRSAVALRDWAVEEWHRGRTVEAESVGKQVPSGINLWDKELTTSGETLAFVDRSERTLRLVEEALFNYRRGRDVAAHAEREYRRHIRTGEEAEIGVYGSQVDNAMAVQSLLAGDYYFLAAAAKEAGFESPMIPAGETVASLRQKSAEAYREAINRYYVLALKYYVEDDVAATVYKAVSGQALDKSNVEKAEAKLYPAMLDAVVAFHEKNNRHNMHAEDVVEYTTYIRRARERLRQIQ